ncbi:MAG TPA: ParB/RepB/Spo0J family partition protein [Puia sp.]|nr:ParB/RepB/Spo0J family partition protein [Puia sp.]
MSTKVVKNKSIKAKTQKSVNSSPSLIQEGELKNVAITDIDFSPLNYRKFFSKKALEDFATEIALHGIISPLMLRSMPSGRYELVAGERRLRAAMIAKLSEVPAVAKILTDEDVIEIQLSENLQREDPHPMHEAQGIGQMQKARKTIDEIAARLGKSKVFVYSRLKLLTLIDALQEMFLADKINLTEAVEIASISAASQQEFYDEYCSDWKEQENFELDNIMYALSRFKYDLKEAPFNPKDKGLLPSAGACTACPSNSATLKTLFPEYAKHAVCTNKECYRKKCDAHFSFSLVSAFQEHKPDALLFHGSDSGIIEEVVRLVPSAGDLLKYNRYEVSILSAPQMPEKEDFSEEWETEEGEEPESDEDGFAQAMEEYNADLEAYNLFIQSGKALKGLLVTKSKTELILFSPEALEQYGSKSKVTAKEVQDAIKAGKATPELLQAEIGRISAREERAKEIDREKVQVLVHSRFNNHIAEVETGVTPTEADKVGARLLIFQSLDYTTRSKVSAVLFGGSEDSDEQEKENLYESLRKLTDHEYSYLIRTAVASKPESKFPNNDTGYVLYQMAESSGLDIATIEEEQEKKSKNREAKQNDRIKELEKKISKMNPAI